MLFNSYIGNLQFINAAFPGASAIHEIIYYAGWTKNTPTRKLRYLRHARFFVLNFAHLFTRQLCKSLLLCAVFTWHTPNWRKRKL